MVNTQHNVPCNNYDECGEVCILYKILHKLAVIK